MQALNEKSAHWEMTLGKLECPHGKRMKEELCTKITSEWLKGSNVRAKTVKLLEESIEVELYDLGFGDNCMPMTSKAEAIE